MTGVGAITVEHLYTNRKHCVPRCSLRMKASLIHCCISHAITICRTPVANRLAETSKVFLYCMVSVACRGSINHVPPGAACYKDIPSVRTQLAQLAVQPCHGMFRDAVTTCVLGKCCHSDKSGGCINQSIPPEYALSQFCFMTLLPL